MKNELQIIAIDAANALRQHVRVCEIGVRRLYVADRTWCVVFGQQPLHEPYVGLVNAIGERIRTEGGEPITVAADDSRTAWVMLARLPFMFDLRTLRTALYELLAEHSPHTADQIRRLARSTGEAAVLDAHDVFTSVAERVGVAVKNLSPFEPCSTPSERAVDEHSDPAF